jgi:hypothetical protein
MHHDPCLLYPKKNKNTPCIAMVNTMPQMGLTIAVATLQQSCSKCSPCPKGSELLSGTGLKLGTVKIQGVLLVLKKVGSFVGLYSFFPGALLQNAA